MPPKDKYTDPELREQVKEELRESDKGGAPGQLSARKVQMMASGYKKRGGDYTTDIETGQDESQKNLSKWGEEEWQTKEGSGNAKQQDGTEKRKRKQHVGNTEKAKESRSAVSKGKSKKKGMRSKRTRMMRTMLKKTMLRMTMAANKIPKKTSPMRMKKTQRMSARLSEFKKCSQQTKPSSSKKQKSNLGKAKENKAEDNSTPKNTKKSKNTVGSKHDPADTEHGPASSADRLPKVGQKVTGKAMPGFVHGKVLEIITEEKDVQGKHVKASKDDPRVALEADSGKFCVHKPEACFYD